jgi:hypothetical protein
MSHIYRVAAIDEARHVWLGTPILTAHIAVQHSHSMSNLEHNFNLPT